jgi:hypothetical protein
MPATSAYRYSFRVPRPNLGSRGFASGDWKALPRQRLPASTSRPPSIEASRVRELKAQGMRPVDIAKALKIGRASVCQVLVCRA